MGIDEFDDVVSIAVEINLLLLGPRQLRCAALPSPPSPSPPPSSAPPYHLHADLLPCSLAQRLISLTASTAPTAVAIRTVRSAGTHQFSTEDQQSSGIPRASAAVANALRTVPVSGACLSASALAVLTRSWVRAGWTSSWHNPRLQTFPFTSVANHAIARNPSQAQAGQARRRGHQTTCIGPKL